MDNSKKKVVEILKKMKKNYDILYLQSISENFTPILHNKEEGRYSYYGSFTIKNGGELYKFTLGEGKVENEYNLPIDSNWVTCRFLTVEKNGKIIYEDWDFNPLLHLDLQFEDGYIDENKAMNAISDLIEDFEIMYSWCRQAS